MTSIIFLVSMLFVVYFLFNPQAKPVFKRLDNVDIPPDIKDYLTSFDEQPKILTYWLRLKYTRHSTVCFYLSLMDTATKQAKRLKTKFNIPVIKSYIDAAHLDTNGQINMWFVHHEINHVEYCGPCFASETEVDKLIYHTFGVDKVMPLRGVEVFVSDGEKTSVAFYDGQTWRPIENKLAEFTTQITHWSPLPHDHEFISTHFALPTYHTGHYTSPLYNMYYRFLVKTKSGELQIASYQRNKWGYEWQDWDNKVVNDVVGWLRVPSISLMSETSLFSHSR